MIRLTDRQTARYSQEMHVICSGTKQKAKKKKMLEKISQSVVNAKFDSHKSTHKNENIEFID